MKMDLFLDTNIVVDIVKYREPYVYDALPIFQGGAAGIHHLLISDLTLFSDIPVLEPNEFLTRY